MPSRTSIWRSHPRAHPTRHLAGARANGLADHLGMLGVDTPEPPDSSPSLHPTTSRPALRDGAALSSPLPSPAPRPALPPAGRVAVAHPGCEVDHDPAAVAAAGAVEWIWKSAGNGSVQSRRRRKAETQTRGHRRLLVALDVDAATLGRELPPGHRLAAWEHGDSALVCLAWASRWRIRVDARRVSAHSFQITSIRDHERRAIGNFDVAQAEPKRLDPRPSSACTRRSPVCSSPSRRDWITKYFVELAGGFPRSDTLAFSAKDCTSAAPAAQRRIIIRIRSTHHDGRARTTTCTPSSMVQAPSSRGRVSSMGKPARGTPAARS